MQKHSKIRSVDVKSAFLKPALIKTVVGSASLVAILFASGCATSELLEPGHQTTRTTPTKQILVEDQLVAFGRPAQALPNMPASSVVIVGEKNSYVLSQGGVEMVNILTNLTPKNIQVDSDMTFYSPNNDGYFQGEMKMSYAKLRDEFKRSDYQFFLQNGGKECTNASDERIGAQRFCFNVPIKGGVYPAVSNLSLIQSKYNALTKPYPVVIYTQYNSQKTTRSDKNAGEKLVLLPFALAFDVVTFPFQLLDAIAN